VHLLLNEIDACQREFGANGLRQSTGQYKLSATVSTTPHSPCHLARQHLCLLCDTYGSATDKGGRVGHRLLAASAAGQSINSALNGAHMVAMLVFPVASGLEIPLCHFETPTPFPFLNPPALTIVLALAAIAIVFYGACIDDMVMTCCSVILAVCSLVSHPAFLRFSPPLWF